MAKAQDLIAVLANKARFEPVDVQETPSQIRILGRVRMDGTSTAMDNWLLMMNAISEREERPETKWRVDISRKYFRRAGRFVFAWRLIIQGDDLPNLLSEIVNVALGAPISTRTEITEIALTGARGDRNVPRRGKGAGISGTVAVGAAAMYPRGGG